jgi:hypothetical protein
VSGDPNVLPVVGYRKFIDMGVRIGDLVGGHASLDVPKLYRVIVSRSGQDKLILLLLGHINL